MLRADHPQAGVALTSKQLAAMRHAVITTAGTGHEAAVEAAFAEQRLSRRVALTIPHFMAVPIIVAQTDVIVTVPRRLALAFAGYPNVRLIEPPIAFPQFEIKQHWHKRYHRDQANKWLRHLIADLFLE